MRARLQLRGSNCTFMGSVERGERNLSFSNLNKIAEALGMTLSQLLSGVERNAEEPKKGNLR